MLIAKTLSELKAMVNLGHVPQNVLDDVIGYADESNEIFEETIGGYIYILERFEDLGQVEGVDFEFSAVHHRYPNLLDKPITVDSCSVMPGGEPFFIVVLLISNNTGGNIFYIPQKLWTANLVKSLC